MCVITYLPVQGHDCGYRGLEAATCGKMFPYNKTLLNFVLTFVIMCKVKFVVNIESFLSSYLEILFNLGLIMSKKSAVVILYYTYYILR